MTFRLLFVGDVVGPAGCSAVLELVPELREQLGLDAVVANAENSVPGGRGITKESGSALLSVVDFLTLGNHAFDAEGYEEYLEREGRIVRPANLDGGYPVGAGASSSRTALRSAWRTCSGKSLSTTLRSHPSRLPTGRLQSSKRSVRTSC